MNKKKLLTLAMVLSMVAILVVGGTIAYFTDTDSDENVFTYGKIDIEQFEMQRDPNAPDTLQPFENDKLIMPAANDPHFDGTNVYWESVQAPGYSEVWPEDMNAQDKFVFVKNTGNQPAYYRTIIALEHPEGVELRTNVNNNTRFDWDYSKAGQQGGNNAKSFYVTVDGVRWEIIVATYTETLAAGETSRPSLLQFALDNDTTQEQIALFGDSITVLTYTQAVQAQGFDARYTEDVACEALNEAFGEINEDLVRDIFNWTVAEEL